MSQLDTLDDQFDRLLGGIGTGYSLEQWRYAYRRIIYSGAMKILEGFPEIIIGPPPDPTPESRQPQQQQQPQQPQQQAQQQQRQQQGPATGGLQIGGPLHPIAAGQPPPYRPSAIHELLCIVLGTCHHQN